MNHHNKPKETIEFNLQSIETIRLSNETLRNKGYQCNRPATIVIISAIMPNFPRKHTLSGVTANIILIFRGKIIEFTKEMVGLGAWWQPLINYGVLLECDLT